MKNNLLKCLIFVFCGMSLLGCEKKNVYEPLFEPRPSFLRIDGSVMDDSSNIVKSVSIYAEAANYDLPLYPEVYPINKDGQYSIRYYFDWFKIEDWPSELLEVTVIAKDTTGVYEMQKKTVPVSVQLRYPNEPDWEWNYIVDGHVTADFVMKKK